MTQTITAAALATAAIEKTLSTVIPGQLTIDDIAEACHEANRTYCQTIGDDSQPAWAAAPD